MPHASNIILTREQCNRPIVLPLSISFHESSFYSILNILPLNVSSHRSSLNMNFHPLAGDPPPPQTLRKEDHAMYLKTRRRKEVVHKSLKNRLTTIAMRNTQKLVTHLFCTNPPQSAHVSCSTGVCQQNHFHHQRSLAPHLLYYQTSLR